MKTRDKIRDLILDRGSDIKSRQIEGVIEYIEGLENRIRALEIYFNQ